eukprot:scaffold652461_cov46-Prasinocladus_malaysianus.AAC.1
MRPDHHGHRVHSGPARAGHQHHGPLSVQQGQQHPLRGPEHPLEGGGGGHPGRAAPPGYRGQLCEGCGRLDPAACAGARLRPYQ